MYFCEHVYIVRCITTLDYDLLCLKKTPVETVHLSWQTKRNTFSSIHIHNYRTDGMS